MPIDLFHDEKGRFCTAVCSPVNDPKQTKIVDITTTLAYDSEGKPFDRDIAYLKVSVCV
jgi:hypothetical protein